MEKTVDDQKIFRLMSDELFKHIHEMVVRNYHESNGLVLEIEKDNRMFTTAKRFKFYTSVLEEHEKLTKIYNLSKAESERRYAVIKELENS